MNMKSEKLLHKHEASVKIFFCIVAAIFLVSCASKPSVNNIESYKGLVEEKEATISGDLNKRIDNTAVLKNVESVDNVYYLGAGDILELTVFQVEELNTKVRVNGRGEIILPLLGKLSVQGKSVDQVEEVIRQKLENDFLQNPQVSLFIDEYRSQQITVMGEVSSPDVYSVRQQRSIFEMLSLAGGLNSSASDKIRVKTTQIDPESNQLIEKDLILSLKKMLDGAENASSIRLSGGDSIFVPKAGVVFVEGAVEKPNSYLMEGEVTVLKAIALAGGIPWSGKESKVQVIRDIGGEPYAIDVNLIKVRNQKSDDIVLQDGDIVVVDHSTAKRFITGFFRTAGQISVSYTHLTLPTIYSV